MKTPLALQNLLHQIARTLVSVAGVGFALLLVFMQLGFQGAVSHTAVNIYKHLQFDLLMRSPEYVHLYEPSQLAKTHLHVAESLPEVQEVFPMWIGLNNWRSLPPLDNPVRLENYVPQYLPVAIMGVEPGDQVFDSPQITAAQRLLATDTVALIDDSTRPDYGPLNGKKFLPQDSARNVEIGGKQFTLAGVFQLGTGLAANAAVLTSAAGFDRIMPWDARAQVSFGLIRLHDPNQAQAVAEQLRERLNPNSATAINSADTPPSPLIEVLTKPQVLNWERQRWLWQTPIGLIFQFGVALSLLVGAAIVYMVLATDVTDRLPEYATLLAMGYTHRYLSSIVLTQAMALAVCGFLSAWAAAEGLYRLTERASGIPIAMNPQRVLGVALLGICVCLLSGVLALRKLWQAEPASLF